VSRESLRLTAPGSAHTVQSPTDSGRGNCRVCRLDRLSAFTAAGRREPYSLQPTPLAPAPSKSRVVSDSSVHRRETPCGGIPALAARGELRSLARRAPVLPMISFTSWGVATLSRRSPFRRWLPAGRSFRSGLQPSLADGAVGRRERLDFRARSSKTAGTVPAMAASRGLAV
jgi:hypothetical protein